MFNGFAGSSAWFSNYLWTADGATRFRPCQNNLFDVNVDMFKVLISLMLRRRHLEFYNVTEIFTEQAESLFTGNDSKNSRARPKVNFLL